jgi:hypothetical protein
LKRGESRGTCKRQIADSGVDAFMRANRRQQREAIMRRGALSVLWSFKRQRNVSGYCVSTVFTIPHRTTRMGGGPAS